MQKNKLLLSSAIVISAAALFFYCCDISVSEKKQTDACINQVEKDNDALEALQFFTTVAAFPNLDIPPDGYARAHEFYRANFFQSKLPVSFASTWQSLGPTNIGGRTLCIAINPTDTSKIWIGSASGGLWKSTTGGIGTNAWTYVPTGFPVLGVSTIAIDPSNPNIMFMGTGETYNYGSTYSGLVDRTTRGSFGMGILKSTDGGNTWTQSLNWTYQQNRGVWEIVFNPLNPNVLYAATTEGIYKSSNSGASWTQVLNVKMAMDLAIDRIDTNIVYCGVGNLSSTGKGLYKTTNSGVSWNILTNGLPANTQLGRIIVSTYYNNPDRLIAQINNNFNTIAFYESTNEGVSWTSISPQDVATYQGWYAKGLLIKPGDPSRVLAGGVNVHASFDGGMNFAQVSSWYSTGNDYVYADIHDIIANPFDPNKIYIVCDGGLFRSNDFGTTFYECAGGYVTSQFYIGSVSAQDSFPAMGGMQDRNSAIYYGTTSWTQVIGGDGSYNAIDPTDDNTIYGSLQYLRVFKSSDQGSNWNQILLSLGNEAFIAPYVVCPSNTQVIYAGRTFIEKSINGGNLWNAVGANPLDGLNRVLTIAVSSTFADTVYCATAASSGNNGDVFLSTNGGGSFTNITNSLPTSRYLRRLTVDPTNSKIVYAAFSGFGGGHIYKSINAGNSWTDISTLLPDIPFHCVAVDPLYPNIIYAGCDLTCFVSTNGGNTWAAFDTGFPEAVMVYDLVVSPSDRKMLAFTHGHGVYKCDLVAGSTGVGNPSIELSDITVTPNPTNGIAFVNFISANEFAAEFFVYNLHGELIKNISTETTTGKNSIRFEMEELPSGTYLVQLKSGDKVRAKKIVLVK